MAAFLDAFFILLSTVILLDGLLRCVSIVDMIAAKNTHRSDVMYGFPDRFGMLHLLQT